MTAPLPGTADQAPPQALHPDVRIWLLIGPALAASLGAFLLTVTIGTEWTAIQGDLQLTASSTIWVFAAYLLPAILAAGVGALLGRGWPTVVGLSATVLLVLGALLTALAPGSGPLLLGRALTGFGAGLAWGVTAVLVRQLSVRRTWVTPLVAGLVVLALILGPVLATLLAQAVGWRWPFMLALPLGAVAFLVTAVGGLVALTRRAAQPVPTPAPPAA
ncbi:MFS transporter [Catellatospora sp. NPDC049609]|uniref:MFS transporter n=1 Tax=Catellatospora sp. NPDC049609 TaxID=3155505 RepID=UPI00342B314C